MADVDYRSLPLDPTSADELRAHGLEYALVPHDGEPFDAFLHAVSRGFLDAAPTPEQVEDSRSALRDRRLTGVFDAGGRHPEVPVGTVDSWITELTTEPGRTVPMWAISAVTVAPTHRRRGIARAMLTGELRTAAAAGMALAGLTVSEATIYGRWGFGPAIYTSDVTVDAHRARWIGPALDGSLDFVPQDELPERLRALHERSRLRRPGEVAGWPGLWRRMAGLRPGEDDARKVRAVASLDAEGRDRGILVYSLTQKGDDYAGHELAVRTLFTADDTAHAALWRFALEHDLVGTVTAGLQPANAPTRWMLSDQRAMRETVVDHHWLRVLDVPAALTSRTYAAPLNLALRVEDSLGFADGAWRVRIDGTGRLSATPTSEHPDVTLDVAALGSILLGGVSPKTLAAAGAIRGDAPIVADLERAFAPAAGPVLSIWY
jgi:predicted acetyltransferase